MGEKVRVAIVGGGRAGAPLIEDFLKRPFIDIVGVADKSPDSPGAVTARANNIFFCEDADVLVAKGDDLDVIIEVSGDPGVKPALRDAFQAQGNRHTVIVTDLVARLILSLAQNSDELLETVHPEDRGIG